MQYHDHFGGGVLRRVRVPARAGFTGAAGALAFALVAGEAEAQSVPPYPPSPVIAGIEWHTDSHRQFGAGSDQWPLTALSDGSVVGAWGDGWGWAEENAGGPKRSIGITRIIGTPPGLRGEDLWGDGPGRGFAKPEALIALGDSLHMFWTNFDSGLDRDTWTGLSTDGGRTWSMSTSKLFPDAPLGYRVRGIIQFGPGYSGAPDDYVYVYSGFIRATDLYLARVPRGRLFEPSAHEWFTGIGRDGEPRWSRDFDRKTPAFHDPNGYVWHIGVSYLPHVGRYLMVKPHYGPGDDRSLERVSEAGVASLGVFDAPTPWGPWSTIYYEDTFIDEFVKFTYMLPTPYLRPEDDSLWLAWSGWPEYDNINFLRGTLQRRK